MRWEVRLTDEVRAWLETCHPEKRHREAVLRKFLFIFALLREGGPGVGEPHARRVRGYDNLWEARANHTTGAYRAFFGVAPTGAVIVVACGAAKKADRFRPEVYREAARRVHQAVSALESLGRDGETHGR